METIDKSPLDLIDLESIFEDDIVCKILRTVDCPNTPTHRVVLRCCGETRFCCDPCLERVQVLLADRYLRGRNSKCVGCKFSHPPHPRLEDYADILPI